MFSAQRGHLIIWCHTKVNKIYEVLEHALQKICAIYAVKYNAMYNVLIHVLIIKITNSVLNGPTKLHLNHI